MGTVEPVTLAGGQIKAYQFTVPANTSSLEVRLDNRVGNPWISLVGSPRLPAPPYYFTYIPYGYGTYYGFGGGDGGIVDDNILTIPNPAPGVYSALTRASGNPNIYPYDYPDATANLVVRQKSNIQLNFAASQNGNGYSNTDSRQMVDGEYNIYQVPVPAMLDGQPVIGWVIHTDVLQGDVSLQVYKDFANPDSGVNIPATTAVVVPPYLTPGDIWYVRVHAVGLTNYTITSRPVTFERPVWAMPVNFNLTFGDSGIDGDGNPLPGDRGIDLAQGEWNFFAVDVPDGNSALLRTELQAISGNPDLFIREDGVPQPTTDQRVIPVRSYTIASSPTQRPSMETGCRLMDAPSDNFARAVRVLGVKANGGSNVRYRLIVSTGQVTDLSLNGGAATNQVLPDNDWRYYRFTVPADAPNTGL